MSAACIEIQVVLTKIRAESFTNAGDTPHSATSFESGKVGTWDTGILNSGESKTITFDKPGNYFYICTPHPGQVIVE